MVFPVSLLSIGILCKHKYIPHLDKNNYYYNLSVPYGICYILPSIMSGCIYYICTRSKVIERSLGSPGSILYIINTYIWIYNTTIVFGWVAAVHLLCMVYSTVMKDQSASSASSNRGRLVTAPCTLVEQNSNLCDFHFNYKC